MLGRILIVDDSPLVHQIYGAELEGAGYEILHAEDGMLAINAVFTEMPDLVLCDVHMPKINGYQVCRLLKDHSATKHIPIIIITGRASYHGVVIDPRSWSFQTGADGYVDKDDSEGLVDFIRPFVENSLKSNVKRVKQPPLSDMEILMALSQLLDKQLYTDVTRLKELDERKTAFVGNVSHELKSQLAIIKGYTEIIKDGLMGEVTEKQANALKQVISTVDRLARLITDLLDVAKIEAGSMALNIQQVDLAALIQEVMTTYAEVFTEKKFSVNTELPFEKVTVDGDRDRLTQVFINLLSNSIKYTPQTGNIVVRLMNENGNVRLELEDNGPGMSRENLVKIFDKFVCLSPGMREATGLGLPIARDIVYLHHGKIWAESEEGKGSRFIVVLPKVWAKG